RHRGVNIIACPSCARQEFQVIPTVAELEKRLAHISTPMTVSVIGCVVNGPGEARETDIGLTGGGSGHHICIYVDEHHVRRRCSGAARVGALAQTTAAAFAAGAAEPAPA